MELINLKICGFGPFLKQQEIDFSSFKEEELFLICGSTGAGKTTIFDAICFALYGSVSGQRKDSKSLKSDFSKSSDFCFVELEFESHGKIYKIVRSPDQFVEKTRGSGLKFLKHRAELTMPDGRLITNLKEIFNLVVDDIIGIDRNNFDRLVMLPQGGFQKLLTEKGEEQTKTFRKLFGTKKYELVADRIFFHKQEILKEYEAIKLKNSEIVKNLSFNFNFSNFEMMSVNELSDAISKKIDEDENSLKNLREEIKKVEQNIENLEARIQIIRRFNQKKDDVKKIEVELDDLENKSSNFNLEKQSWLVETVESLNKLNCSFEEAKKIFQEKLNFLENLKETLRLEQENLKESQLNFKKVPKLKFELENLKEARLNLEYVKKNFEVLKNLEQEVVRLKVSLKKVLDELEVLNVKKVLLNLKIQADLHVKIIKNLEELIKNLEEYSKTEKNVETLNLQYLNGCRKFYEQQAFLISKNLKEGQPCPVCGSFVHPAKPKEILSCELVTENKIEILRNNVSLEKDRLNNFKNSMVVLKAELKEILDEDLIYDSLESVKNCHNDQVKKLEEIRLNLKQNVDRKFWNLKVSSEENYEDLIKELEIEKSKILANFSGLEKRKVEIFKDIPENFKTVEHVLEEERAILKRVGFLKDEIEKFENDKVEAEKNLEVLKAKFKFENESFNELNLKKKQAEEELNEKLKISKFSFEEFLKISESLESLKKQLEEGKITLKKIETLELKKQILQQDLKNFEDCSDDDVFKLKCEEQEKLQGLKEKDSELVKKIALNLNCFNELKKNCNKFNELENNYSMVKTLSDVAKGSKKRVGFERYVLTNLINEVLVFANRWLIKITQSRYCFSKMDVSTSAPLSFNVFDFFSGNVRHVSSLSGGETFAASLALSLGLCESISKKNGGIELKTMLIDEGFGTLDSDYLDSVVDCLTSLKKTGRTIGLISHIPELKSRIKAKIQVKKCQKTGGSKIEVVH